MAVVLEARDPRIEAAALALADAFPARPRACILRVDQRTLVDHRVILDIAVCQLHLPARFARLPISYVRYVWASQLIMRIWDFSMCAGEKTHIFAGTSMVDNFRG